MKRFLTSGVHTACMSSWSFLPTMAVWTISTGMCIDLFVMDIAFERVLIALTALQFIHYGSVNSLLSFYGRGSCHSRSHFCLVFQCLVLLCEILKSVAFLFECYLQLRILCVQSFHFLAYSWCPSASALQIKDSLNNRLIFPPAHRLHV